MENQLYSYYGWDPLWGGVNLSAIPGAMASPLMAPHYMGLGPQPTRPKLPATAGCGEPTRICAASSK